MIIKQQVYEQADAGIHEAQITEIKDLGMVETAWGVKEKVRVVFKVLDQQDSEGGDIVAFYTCVKSLNEKSTLTKLLNQLGVPVVNGEVDLDNLIGIKCQIVIEHRETNGKVYGNITAVIRKKVVAPRPPAAVKPAPKPLKPAPKPVVVPDDEDIPF